VNQASRKSLGFVALFAISLGTIVGQIGMVSVLQSLGIGGTAFFVGFAIAFAIALCNAISFAELAVSLPRAGSISTYAEVSVGHFPAILAVFAGYVAPAMFGAAAELMLFDSVIGQVLPGVLPPLTWAFLLLGAAAILNIMGTDVFASLQTALTFMMIVFAIVTGTWAAMGGVGIVGGALPHEQSWAVLSTNTSALSVVVLSFFALMGSEFVTPMIEEARAPARDLARAMLGGLICIFLAYALFAFGAANYVPRELLSSSPTPHFELIGAIFGNAGRLVFATVALTASASLINTVLGAVPRMLYGMAMNGQVFPIFKRLYGKKQTPVPAILFMALCPVVGIVWSGGDVSNIVPLLVAATVCWLLTYMLAHVAVLILRQRHPELPRPYRTPFYPLPQLFAIPGIVVIIANSSPAPEMTRTIVYYTVGVLGTFSVVGVLWVKLFMRQPFFKPLPIGTAMHVGEN
jgi:amino acid transporter